MLRLLTAVNLCEGLSRLSDAELEANYGKILARAQEAPEIWADFRHVEWFDLWALVQLLFLLDSEHLRNVPRKVLLRSPNAVGGTYDRSNREREIVKAGLQFLSDIEFLDRAMELGAELWLQDQLDPRNLEKVDPTIIRQITDPNSDLHLVADDSRPIIPITRLSTLDLSEKRDQLYQRAEQIFGGFHTESIVESAGLGDCLLTELALNVRHHGGEDGYVALRAGAGLYRIKRDSPKDYRIQRRFRSHHRLGDWRTYFRSRPDDAYFELIVADRGPGIASSIVQDPRLPDRVREPPESLTKMHALIEYAMEAESSRHSPEERTRRGMTDFTGLAAVRFVLEAHNGALLIREPCSRHVFGAAATGGPTALTMFDHLCSASRVKPIPTQQLHHIPGVSVTAIIPMQRVHHHPVGVDIRHTLTHVASESSDLHRRIAVFRAPRGTPAHATFLDENLGQSWRTIAPRIQALDPTIRLVVIDIAQTSLEKNELWPGIVVVSKACWERGLGLVFAGITERFVSRIEEFASLDKRKIANGTDWLTAGFGDQATGYVFGMFGHNPEERRAVAHEVIGVIGGDVRVTPRIERLLHGTNYLEAEEQGKEKQYSRLVLRPTATFAQVRAALQIAYEQSLATEIAQTSAWLPGRPVQLAARTMVADYLCVHSVTQLRHLYPDLARLAVMWASLFEFDFILSVGTAAQGAARIIAETLSHRHLASTEGSISHYAYQDYFSFDHGEGPRQLIRRESKVLVVVDAIRSGAHTQEVVEHVRHCDAEVVGIVTLFDLSEGQKVRDLNGIPVGAALKLPVRRLTAEMEAEFVEVPFSLELQAATQTSETDTTTLLSKAQAYRYLEAYGLIMCGHSTFFEQHFERTISLPYLLNSSAPMKAELVYCAMDLIRREKIDSILFPEHSSISALVDSVAKSCSPDSVSTIMCRRTAWPDSAGRYALDLVGKHRLAAARNVLILEDESYTGNSIKGLLAIALGRGEGIRKVVIFTVVDSMRHSERTSLRGLLAAASGSGGTGAGRCEIKTIAFMRFSVCAYWTSESCPLCRELRMMERPDFRQLGFIEDAYAQERIKELTPHQTDQDYRARRAARRLPSFFAAQRPLAREVVTISTYEGLEIYCEEAYVEGDLSWLVDRCHPSDPEHFHLETLVAVIELLSRDFGVW